jgi:hypothetical protein
MSDASLEAATGLCMRHKQARVYCEPECDRVFLPVTHSSQLALVKDGLSVYIGANDHRDRTWDEKSRTIIDDSGGSDADFFLRSGDTLFFYK